MSRLTSAGIETVLLGPADPLAQEARRLNDAFAFSITHGRPFVTLKAALSIDGKLAPPPASRAETAPHWLTGEAARTDVQQIRHSHDAILTGIGTVIADNPSLTDRSGLARRRPLLRLVLDSHLRIPLNSNLVSTAHGDLIVLCGPRASAQSEAALVREGIEVLRLADPGDLMQLFAALRSYDLRSILLESGTQLNGAFFSADLVDSVVLYYAESELGPAAVPFSADGTSPFELQQRLTSITRTSFPHGAGEDIRIRGYLHDPWS